MTKTCPGGHAGGMGYGSPRSQGEDMTAWAGQDARHGWRLIPSCCVLVLAVFSVAVVEAAPGGALDVSLSPTALSASSFDQLEEFEEAEPLQVSMDFQDASLRDVLKVFSQQTGINVIAGQDVEDRTITLYFEEVTAMDALDQILDSSDLLYVRPQGSEIYIVRPKPMMIDEEPEPVAETRVYRLKYARVSTSRLARAVEALVSQTPFEAQSLAASTSGGGTGGGGGGAGVFAGGGGGGGGGGAEDDVGIDTIIQEVLTDRGQVMVDARTNSLIITDLPDNFARIESVLEALDVRTAQILIEAEILETTLSNIKDLGMEWGGATDGKLFTIDGAKRSTRFPFSISQVERGLVDPDNRGITLGTLDASFLDGVLQALERDTDTKILARPRILTLDNESAVIRLTSQQAVSIASTSQEGNTNVLTAPERVTTGVILVVTPQVNEGGHITMLVEPAVSKVVSSSLANTFDPKTRSVRTLVRIREGETLVLGGLIDRTEEKQLQRVPVLSGIPFLGEVFKNREADNTATELIVFVTPRIVSEGTGSWTPTTSMSSTAREQGLSRSRRDTMEQSLNRMEWSAW